MLHHQHIVVESKINVDRRGDVREHDIVHVGIDTASPTLATIHSNAVCATILHIHLSVHKLVAPEDNRRFNLPHKEIFVGRKVTSHILLHSQIERQSVLFF